MWNNIRSIFARWFGSSPTNRRPGGARYQSPSRSAAGWGSDPAIAAESQLPGNEPPKGSRGEEDADEAPGEQAPHETGAAPWSTPDPLPEIATLDSEESFKVICLDDEPVRSDLEERIQQRIELGKLSLSHLPSTSIAVMQLASKPGASVTEIVETIEPDPVLSTELLKTANSILYGGRVPTQSIRGAVMRIGMRSLRTMILGFSMHNALLRTANLKAYGEKVWRQAFTIASMARNIADRVGFEPEQAFLLGLLHDVGKLAILDTLSKELKDDTELSPSLVGRLFMRWHEVAGRKMAVSWKLTDELISVAGCHHAFEENENFPRSAALVSLSHRAELFLSLNAMEEFRDLLECPEFEALGLAPGPRQGVLDELENTYFSLHARPPQPEGGDEESNEESGDAGDGESASAA